MATFCIPKHAVEKLKQSALKGNVDVQSLYEMSSKERREFFIKYTDQELGKLINTEFEKAMVSKQKAAITDWAKSVFKPEAKTPPAYKTILDKIDSLDELGVLSPETENAFLEDLVSDKLGITVTPEEVKSISEKAKKIQEAQEKLGDNLGSPTHTDENVEFFKAKKEMDDYLLSLSPANKLKVLTGTVGRGVMLASVKSPLLNIGSNIELAFTEALSRRANNLQLRGADNKLAVSYVKMVNKIYQQTGYDLSRMTKLSDTGASGARVLGDTVHSQGKGLIRKAGQIIEDTVFKQLMGAPDVAFSGAHFADSVNLNAMKMADGNKVQAKEWMEDSMRIEPQTPQGEILREQAILDAQKATWTDNSWASKVSEGIRKIFNEVSGDARVGDYLFPFVKTPANVISTGIDYAGGGVVKAIYETVRSIRNGNLGSKEYFQNITRGLVRSGLGFTAAVIIANNLNDDDFVGAYDPQRSQIEQLRNSNYNAVRIGDKWISMDWFGPLAVPLTAIMYARQHGKTGAEKTFQYGVGALSSVYNLPGVKDIYGEIKSHAYSKNQSLSEATGALQDYITEQLYSRLVPSIVGDVAKATDEYQRKTGTGFQAVKSRIPGLRQTLPIKTNVFGEKMADEGASANILFGSRVKTDQENKAIREISRLSNDLDKSISFTDWDKSSSKVLASFKQKVGQKRFDEAKIKYGKELKSKLQDVVNNPKYQKMSDDDKLIIINGLDTEAQQKILKQYGFVYHRVVTKKPKL